MTTERKSKPNARFAVIQTPAKKQNRRDKNVWAKEEIYKPTTDFKPKTIRFAKEQEQFQNVGRIGRTWKKADSRHSNIEFDPEWTSWHPFPYVITPDVYLFDLEDDEEQKPRPPLDEHIVERVMLDTAFAKNFIDQILIEFVEVLTRDVVLTFTDRQGPANKPLDKVKTMPPAAGAQIPSTLVQQEKKDKNKKNKKEDVIYDIIIEDMLKEEIRNQLRNLLWHTLDHQALMIDEPTFKILSSDPVKLLSITLDQQGQLHKHVIKVGKGLVKTRTNDVPYDYSHFKDMKTRNYIYQFHKEWRQLMIPNNFAEKELKLKFCNEAISNYFYKECLDAVDSFMHEMDAEETRNRTLKYFGSLETP